jgi:hypothetical protein
LRCCSHIIDRYDSLAPITIFAHAARFAWHNDDPDYDGLATFRNLRLDYVRSAGYVNLRCVWVLGCPGEIRPGLDALDGSYEDAIRDPQPGQALTAKRVYKQAFQELMPGVQLPSLVGVACCSQFAVSRETIRSRPHEDYVRWRTWLLETELTDDLSGRVLEYMWHSKLSNLPCFTDSKRQFELTGQQLSLAKMRYIVRMPAIATAKFTDYAT